MSANVGSIASLPSPLPSRSVSSVGLLQIFGLACLPISVLLLAPAGFVLVTVQLAQLFLICLCSWVVDMVEVACHDANVLISPAHVARGKLRSPGCPHWDFETFWARGLAKYVVARPHSATLTRQLLSSQHVGQSCAMGFVCGCCHCWLKVALIARCGGNLQVQYWKLFRFKPFLTQRWYCILGPSNWLAQVVSVIHRLVASDCLVSCEMASAHMSVQPWLVWLQCVDGIQHMGVNTQVDMFYYARLAEWVGGWGLQKSKAERCDEWLFCPASIWSNHSLVSAIGMWNKNRAV